MKQDDILYVGIDPSINSTGIAMLHNKYMQFYQITPNKVQCSCTTHNVIYKRLETNAKNYTADDLNKIRNGRTLAGVIMKLVQQTQTILKEKNCTVKEIHVRMEGSLMSSGFKNKQSRVNDLVANNSIIKLALVQHLDANNIQNIEIIAPSQLKKRYTGKGNCGKDLMMETFAKNVPQYDFTQGKNDDIADAHALAFV